MRLHVVRPKLTTCNEKGSSPSSPMFAKLTYKVTGDAFACGKAETYDL